MRSLFLLMLAFLITGCAHTRLSCNATKQARTLTEIEEQQVLDNIAMFVVNCGSTPYFALPNGGGTQTNQSGTASSTLIWNPTTLTGANGGLNGTAGTTINWTLKPINEPERLQLMKCVYQHVTQNFPSSDCVNCQDYLTRFFGKNYPVCDVPTGWFSVCDKKPRNSNCCVKVGHYCGTYITVSEEYLEYLSRVTIAILDIATVDNAVLVSKLANSPKVQIEETFEVVGSDNRKTTIKGTLKIDESEYLTLKGEVPKETLFPAESDRARPRRESGSSFESLLQLNSNK